MGQPELHLGLSHITRNKSRWSEVVVLITILSCVVNALAEPSPNCEFKPEPGDGTVILKNYTGYWIIIGKPISEKLNASEIIWNVATENIIGSAASAYPHAKYLTGYRYDSSYMYRTSASFPDFMETEYFTEVQRNVTFKCEDGEDQRVHFKFPLIDVNDPPTFTRQGPVELTVDLDTVNENTVINENVVIEVKEIDFTPENLNVVTSSDRSDLLVVNQTIKGELGKGVGKLFDIQLKLNLENGKDEIVPGTYSLNLFCFDGQYTNSLRLIIDIKKALN